jgi:hypothetical protein
VLLDLDALGRLVPLFGSTIANGRTGRRRRPVPMIERADYGGALLARVLYGAEPWHEISYRSGDGFDLRRANVVLVVQDRQHRRRLPLPVVDAIRVEPADRYDRFGTVEAWRTHATSGPQ